MTVYEWNATSEEGMAMLQKLLDTDCLLPVEPPDAIVTYGSDGFRFIEGSVIAGKRYELRGVTDE